MPAQCDMSVARTEGGFIVRVRGNGTSANSPALSEFVIGCFEQAPDASVLVDLLGCDYLDSTFLGCLLNLKRATRATGFLVVADEDTRTRLLAATRVDSVLSLIAEPPSTISRFIGLDSTQVSTRALGKHVMHAHRALSELPSNAAPAFKKIADQLERELNQDGGRDDANLYDTVIEPRKKKK